MKKMILITLAAVIALAVLVLAGFGAYNTKIVDRTVDEGMAALEEHFEVSEIPAEPYDTIMLFGLLRCDITHYDVSGLGNLCVMKFHAGFMQMATFVLSPYDRNMPLQSMDFEYILWLRKIRVEYYDLASDTEDAGFSAALSDQQSVFDSYADISDFTHRETPHDSLFGAYAFKEASISQEDRVRGLFVDSISAYAADAENMPELSETQVEEKRALTQQFFMDLIAERGPGAKMFIKTLGEDGVADFYEKVFFGTLCQ